jgi:1-acyl-sn-glycerol-3-phosphate acyltransferase
MKLFRAPLVGDPPTEFPCVIVGAPHTSNWDYLMMLGVAWSNGLNPFWLGKKEMFEGPLTPFFRWTRGMPVDRDDPTGLIEEVLEASRKYDKFALVITPEGTRKKGEYWKSGFRRIAKEGNMPVKLAFPRGQGREAGFGPMLRVTDDLVSDMEELRAFYKDKPGIVPANATPPRLREEGSGTYS